MQHDLDWKAIRRVIARAPYCSIASVDEDGRPRVTPIGSVYLGTDGTGYFLERFTRGLPRNIDHSSPITLMAVDAGRLFWLRSLIAGGFPTPPAIRLRGVAGPRRKAKDEEKARFLDRLRLLRWTKGHRILWSDFAWARDLDFREEIPIRLGSMRRAPAFPSQPARGPERPADSRRTADDLG